MSQKPIPSLFVVYEGFVIDLEAISYIKDECVGFKLGKENEIYVPHEVEAITQAWIAFKGKFDPKKDR